MGYFYWDAIPRTKDDQTRIAAFVASELAQQDELSELGDVNIPAPGEGNVLTYEAPKWIAKAPAVGDGDLSLLHEARRNYHYSLLLTKNEAISGYDIRANTLWAIAFPIPIQWTVDRIFRIRSGGAINCRLGIYNAGTNCYPGTLRLDAGVLTSAGSEIVISQTLPAGLYWLAIVAAAINLLICNEVTYYQGIIGSETVALGMDMGPTWKVAQAYGALPDPFPAGASIAPQLLALGFRRSG